MFRSRHISHRSSACARCSAGVRSRWHATHNPPGATGSKASTYSVPGTIAAILLVAVGVTGLQLLGAEGWVTNFFNGAVLLAAVLLSQLARKRSG